MIGYSVTSLMVFQFKSSFMLSGKYAQICPSSAFFPSVFLQVFGNLMDTVQWSTRLVVVGGQSSR